MSDTTRRKPKWKPSKGKSKYGDARIELRFKTLGLANAIVAGDMIRRTMVMREEARAQDGPVKTLFLDGYPVPLEDQLLSKAEIRAKRGAQ